MSANHDLPKPEWNLDGTINRDGHKLWPAYNDLFARTKKRGVKLELHAKDGMKIVVREKMSPSTEVLRQKPVVDGDFDAAAMELLK